MDFFAAQDRSRAKTTRLVILFICAVFAVVISVYAVIIGVMFKTSSSPDFKWFDPKLFFIIGGGTLAIILVGSIAKTVALSKGGSYVAQSLGGRLIQPATTDAGERKVLNVVEEMAIASGVPVPQVYILDGEKGINAFAAGYSPSDAVVAVTRGCAEQLTRDELQGVVAHEFSHILNGDMRLNIRLIGLLSGIMLIATIGRMILRSGSRGRVRTKSSGKGGGQIYLIALLLLVVGYIGVLMGRLIQSAVSRQREFLADASAVQFTRNPLGIANALKKIGGFSSGSKIRSPSAGEACHMFFAEAVSSLFSTHPPLKERIKRIDPGFSGELKTGEKPVMTAGMEAAAASWALDPSVSRISAVAPAVVKQVGNATPEHVSHGAALLAAVPDKIKAEAGDILGASALVCALLLSNDEKEKERQIKLLGKSAPPEMRRHVLLLDNALSDLDPRLRLPVLDLAIPALRMMSQKQYMDLKGYIKTLVEADNKLSVFEFSLREVIAFRVEAAFTAKTPKIRYKSITPLTDDCVRLLSALASYGHTDPGDAENAFSSGIAVLPVKKEGIVMLPGAGIPFEDLHVALVHFSVSSAGVKKAVFEACAHCVLYDKTVSIHEAELLRAIAYSMDIPLPPFLSES